jgi:hypothetical protein|tara:strand:- start:966 stop:1106 length:141 start_codon:yes stop_codon:yes gene_type:complete
MAVKKLSTLTGEKESNLNPLFMNTKCFNMKTAEHAAAKKQQKMFDA